MLNQTIQDEFYSVAFRKKLYGSMDELQHDLDQYMRPYNNEYANQGKRCRGRTLMETFLDRLTLYHHYVRGGPNALKMLNWEIDAEGNLSTHFHTHAVKLPWHEGIPKFKEGSIAPT